MYLSICGDRGMIMADQYAKTKESALKSLALEWDEVSLSDNIGEVEGEENQQSFRDIVDFICQPENPKPKYIYISFLEPFNDLYARQSLGKYYNCEENAPHILRRRYA